MRLPSWLALGLCVGALAGVTMGLSRCFNPDLPACAYRCNTVEPRCPDEYECRSDGYCHLRGNMESCPYTMDLLPPPPPPDFSSTDLATADMSKLD